MHLRTAQVRWRGCVSFGDFSLHKQRKDTRSPAGEWNALRLNVTRSPIGEWKLRTSGEWSALLQKATPQHKNTLRLRVTATCLLLAGIASAHAQDDDPQRATQEAQAKQKLDQVRAEIHQLADAQKATSGEKTDVAAALREQELKMATSAKELRTLDQKLIAQQDKLADLQAQRTTLNAKLKLQRDTLAVLLRSAYALGHDEELRLLLAQDDAGKIGRMLAYYRYFEHARIAQISALLNDLEALVQVQQAIDSETANIKASREERAADALRLQAERRRTPSRADADLDAVLKR